mmetsp:Transcript_20967/g.25881  ORF Transcript_20967/g.25881 Transcript_20967/m.25881 type:complete len:257 (+) Transcript_20967:152-922(+)
MEPWSLQVRGDACGKDLVQQHRCQVFICDTTLQMAGAVGDLARSPQQALARRLSVPGGHQVRRDEDLRCKLLQGLSQTFQRSHQQIVEGAVLPHLKEQAFIQQLGRPLTLLHAGGIPTVTQSPGDLWEDALLHNFRNQLGVWIIIAHELSEGGHLLEPVEGFQLRRSQSFLGTPGAAAAAEAQGIPPKSRMLYEKGEDFWQGQVHKGLSVLFLQLLLGGLECLQHGRCAGKVLGHVLQQLTMDCSTEATPIFGRLL